MDEFFFDANDKDKPAHVTGFHDIGGGGSSAGATTKTMKIDESIMSAVIDNTVPIIASNIVSIARHSNKQPFEQSGVFFEPTRDNADRTLVDFKPLPTYSHTSKHIDRVMRIATTTSLGDVDGTNAPDEETEEDDTTLPTSFPPSPISSDLGDEDNEGYLTDITEEYSSESDDDSSSSPQRANVMRASASAAASRSARDARSASTRAQMAVNRMRNAQKSSTGAAASTARSAAKAARTAATSASLSSTAAMTGRVMKTARDQSQGQKERTDKNYKDMSTLVSNYIKNPAVHKFNDQESEEKVTKLAQTLRNPVNATKPGLRARTMNKIDNIRSWQTNKMRTQLRANMKPMARRTTSKVKNSDE